VRRLVLALACLALLAAVPACGGDDEEASDEEQITVTDTTDETTTDETDIFEGLDSEECLQLASIGAAIGQALSGQGGTQSEESAELLAELVEEAPDEIRADIQTVADGLGEYIEAIRDLDLQEGQTPTADQLQQIQAAIASIDQPELQAASERLSTWAEENC
jgi:hypothetical protein